MQLNVQCYWFNCFLFNFKKCITICVFYFIKFAKKQNDSTFHENVQYRFTGEQEDLHKQKDTNIKFIMEMSVVPKHHAQDGKQNKIQNTLQYSTKATTLQIMITKTKAVQKWATFTFINNKMEETKTC